jgi:hypothetical protein
MKGEENMKKFLAGCFFLLILYVVAYDLKIGTLPQTEPVTASVKLPSHKKQEKYQLYKVKPGDTLISVVEKLNDSSDYTIVSMIKDFKTLNPKSNPENIQIGKLYKFPLYKKTER